MFDENRSDEIQDRLASLFRALHIGARIFHTGALCGVVPFGEQQGKGHLHLLRAGRIDVIDRAGAATALNAPAAMLFPRPSDHRLDSHGLTVDLVCAEIDLGGVGHPLRHALPASLLMDLRPGDDIDQALALLFSEADRQRPGRQALLDRLAEVVLILLLRRSLSGPADGAGLIAGMTHPAIGKALAAIHAAPERGWSLESLADLAGMSRSAFAERFRQLLGETPGAYLNRWRLALAYDLLGSGQAVKTVARQVGYDSAAAFSRAFSRHYGRSASSLTS